MAHLAKPAGCGKFHLFNRAHCVDRPGAGSWAKQFGSQFLGLIAGNDRPGKSGAIVPAGIDTGAGPPLLGADGLSAVPPQGPFLPLHHIGQRVRRFAHAASRAAPACASWMQVGVRLHHGTCAGVLDQSLFRFDRIETGL
jgi:hypothetical protein